MKRIFSFVFALAFAGLVACAPDNVIADNTNPIVKPDDDTKQEIVATAIALSEHELVLEKGTSEVLTVSFTPENTTNKSLTWVSSNKSIVEVTDGVVVAIDAGKTDIVVKCGDLVDRCSVSVTSAAMSISLNQETMTLFVGESGKLEATVLPQNTTDTLFWDSSAPEVASVENGIVSALSKGSATITASVGTHSSQCVVTIKNPVPTGAVDLGLSVYWATCNLGAKTPEQYGGYYAWGETETKDVYYPSNYVWATNESTTSPKHFSKYNYSDGKKELDLEDDAARVILQGTWRIPTISEIQELHDNCLFEETEVNNIRGVLLTSVINDKSIFLPYAGSWFWTSSKAQYVLLKVGSAAFIRSRNCTPDQWEDSPKINTFYWGQYYDSTLGDFVLRSDSALNCYRWCGFTIRPVAE